MFHCSLEYGSKFLVLLLMSCSFIALRAVVDGIDLLLASHSLEFTTF